MEENKGLNEENLDEVLDETEVETEVIDETCDEGNSDDSNNEKESHEEDVLSSMRKIKEENKKLVDELEVLKDRILRLTAEYENYRKRTVKEKEGIYTDSCTDVLKQVIPSMDNLERALSVDGSIEDLKKGIEMTMKGFKDSLEKLGVEEIDTENGFDPNYHQAVMHIEDDSLGKNCVAEVFLKGYKKNDKVIRHTMVKVAN